MSSVINTNVKSVVAQNALIKNDRLLSKSMEQLSSGKRINSAADDAAGLAISNKMTSQIRGLNQAVRNANDGVSMLQTAEGAMVEITNMMQRMRELAVQSANDTNTADDRAYLDLEFQQLKQESNRITQNTQWNGMNVLDGSFTGNTTAGLFKFQVGANASQTISHTIDQFGYGTSSGTAAFTTAVASNVQTSTLTIGGTYAKGDVINLSVNGQSLQYTVTADDVGGANATDNTKLIAASIKSALDTASGTANSFAGLTTAYTANSATMTFAGAANVGFVVSSSTNNGKLANIAGLNITDASGSNTAIKGLDVALKNVNNARANIGSVINRLTYAADNLSNVSMNTSASRSRVLDTDYASATTELARSQIISQAATAMLAQANQQPQSVLSLLK